MVGDVDCGGVACVEGVVGVGEGEFGPGEVFEGEAWERLGR